jgi:vacuolar-type H+-ATPase subunit I/STV1
MSTAAERNAEKDGYKFTGNYEHDYNKDKLKPIAVELRQQGFRVRTIASSGGGFSLYVKDTPKTIKAKEKQAAKDETARKELAVEVAEFLKVVSEQVADLSACKLRSIRWVVERELKN